MKYTQEEKQNLYYKDHPYEYVIDIIGVKECSVSKDHWFAMTDAEKGLYRSLVKRAPEITWQQKEVLEAIPECIGLGKPIAIRSGHGVGKTGLISWIIIWGMNTHPFIKIPCTSGKENQIKDILWSELAKWHRKLPNIVKQNTHWTATEYKSTKYGEDWFAVARTATQPENMQGFHAPYLMFLIDEAPAVMHEIFEVIMGALSTEGAFSLMTGNPTLLEGEFYTAFHKNRKLYKLFHFSSADSPLVSSSYPSDVATKYGRDSDIYRVRVLGDFPLAGEDVFISMQDVEKAKLRNDTKYTQMDTIYIGGDIARFGDDETVMCVRRGYKVIHQETWAKKGIPETVGRIWGFVMKNFKGLGFKIVISIDDTGVGGGVTDGLNYNIDRDDCEDWISVIAENNGATPLLKDERGNLLYKNRGTELWACIRDNIGKLDLPDDEELTAQLSTRKYKIGADGRIELEKKIEMKKRGLKSPDRADALSLTFSSFVRNDAELMMI